MARRILIAIGLAFSMLIFLVTCLIGWGLYFGPPSTIGATLASGRSVFGSARTMFISMETAGDVATIRMWGSTIIVEPDCVIVNGLPAKPIPAQAKEVMINSDRGQVGIVVDGEPVKP